MAKKRLASQDEYISKIAIALTSDLFEVFSRESEEYGEEVAESLSLSVLRNMIYVLVDHSFKDVDIPDEATDEQAAKLIEASFAVMKSNIQNCIAEGFEHAMEKFSGQNLGYYVKILTAGKPINKLEI